MSFALYLEFAHSLQSFEFIKKKNFQDKKLISIVYFKKQSNKKNKQKSHKSLFESLSKNTQKYMEVKYLD